MAIWQFKVEIIPEDAVAQRQVISLEEWDEELWWLEKQPSQDFLIELANILPAHKSWSKNLCQWGRQESDLIEVWREAGKVESISARVETRQINYNFIRQLVACVYKYHCRFVYARYRTILPLGYNEFLESLTGSPNYKVVSNPSEWLPKMAQEVLDEEKSR